MFIDGRCVPVTKAPEGRHVAFLSESRIIRIQRRKRRSNSRGSVIQFCLSLQRSDMSIAADTSNPRAPEERNVVLSHTVRRGWVTQDTNNVMQYSWLNEHTTIAQHIGYLAR